MGPAHTAEDLAIWLPQRRVLVAGDFEFRDRIPFVGQADSGRWLDALDRRLAYDVGVITPRLGPAMHSSRADVQLTRDYLAFLRKRMGKAACLLEPVEEAYARTDWSRFAHLPLFALANRMNAFNTHLLMERNPP